MRVLKHTRWALMAGALGMSLASLCALEPSGLSGYSTPAVQKTHQHSAAADRVTEIKVELALLADPATFGCELAAHIDGVADALEVRGYVPNETVREQALKVA